MFFVKMVFSSIRMNVVVVFLVAVVLRDSKEVLLNQLHLRVQQSQCLDPSKRWTLSRQAGTLFNAEGSYLVPSLKLTVRP